MRVIVTYIEALPKRMTEGFGLQLGLAKVEMSGRNSYTGPPGRVWVDVADSFSMIAIEAAAHRADIVVRAISRFYRAARPRPGLMLGFSGFPRQLIVPSAARLAALVARHGRA